MTATAYEILTNAATKAHGDGLYELRGTIYHLSDEARREVHDRCVAELEQFSVQRQRRFDDWLFYVMLVLSCVGILKLVELLDALLT
jgi:hypothetical protein